MWQTRAAEEMAMTIVLAPCRTLMLRHGLSVLILILEPFVTLINLINMMIAQLRGGVSATSQMVTTATR